MRILRLFLNTGTLNNFIKNASTIINHIQFGCGYKNILYTLKC